MTFLLCGLPMGCSNGADPDVEVMAETGERNAETTASVPDGAESADEDKEMEFNADGLVPIPPGTATTKVFVPTFEYTVPLGWFITNAGEEVDSINVVRQLEPSARIILVRRIGDETVDEMIQRLVEEPGWDMLNEVLDARLGNSAAKQLDGVATEVFDLYENSLGVGISADPGDRIRVLLASVDGWTVAVFVAASVDEFESFAKEATTLLDTMRFLPAQEPLR